MVLEFQQLERGVTSLSCGRAQGTSGYHPAQLQPPEKSPGSTWLGKSIPSPPPSAPSSSTALYPFWSSWELPEVFAPWGIGEHGQVALLWRDEDETPNSLLSCLKPCRLLEDFLEDVFLTDGAGKLSLPKKVGINSLPR